MIMETTFSMSTIEEEQEIGVSMKNLSADKNTTMD